MDKNEIKQRIKIETDMIESIVIEPGYASLKSYMSGYHAGRREILNELLDEAEDDLDLPKAVPIDLVTETFSGLLLNGKEIK